MDPKHKPSFFVPPEEFRSYPTHYGAHLLRKPWVSSYHFLHITFHYQHPLPQYILPFGKEKYPSQKRAEPQFLTYESKAKSNRNTILITNQESGYTKIMQPDPYITQAGKLSVTFLQYLSLSQQKKNDTLQIGIMDQ